jgi:capsular polysaccharide biosynthesis protein
MTKLRAVRGRLRALGRLRSPPEGDGALTGTAARLGWTVDDQTRSFLRELEERLPGDGRATVAVLTGDRGSRLPALLAAHLPHCRVSCYKAYGEPQRHVAMAAAGRFDLVVDDTRTGAGRADLLRSVFFHLRPGGSLLVRHATAQAGGASPEGPDNGRLPRLVGRLAAERVSGSRPAKRRGGSAEQVLAAAMRDLTIRDDHLAASNRTPALAKLREEHTNEFLRLRGDAAGRVLEVREPSVLESRATVTQSASERARKLPERYDVPAVSLREYHDVHCAPGQLVWQRNVLLPDSFRHNQRPNLGNRYTVGLGPLFARPKQRARHVHRLEGPYFYLDSEFRGHFGHAMTEQLSRLWAWPQAKAAEPGLKAVMALNKRRELAQFEIDLYSAAGIAAADLVLVRDTVHVDSLFAATPMFSQPDYVHPDLAGVWRAVATNLAAAAPERDYSRKVFCARRTGKRPCRNAVQVEELFAEHGFDVIFSEDYPLSEQARIFQEADVIAGFAGSALFNLSLCNGPKHVIMISSESYIAQNEYMIASLLGHRLDIAWCRPEIPMPEDRWWVRAFHSPFTFDFEREGRFVADVLVNL